MATKEQVSRTVLQYDVDAASIGKVIKATDKVEKSITDSLNTLGDYGPTTKAAMRSVEVGFNALDRNIKSSQAELASLHRDLASLDDLVVTPQVRIQSDGKDLEGARQGVGDLSSLLGAGASASGLNSLAGVGDILGLAEYIPLAGQALASLTPTMIGITGGALLLAPAIAAVTGEIDKNTQREKARAEALEQVAEAIVNGTRAEVQNRIAALETENQIRETQIQLIERQTGRSRQYLEELTRVDANDFSLIGSLADLADTIGGLGGSAGVVVEANNTIEQNTFLIDALQQVLGENATATNDATSAEHDLMQARLDAADQGIQSEIEHQQLLRTGTASAIRDRIQALTEEQTAVRQAFRSIQSTADVSEEASDKLADYADRMIEIADDVGYLTREILPLVEARERLAQSETALVDLTTNLFDAQTKETEARQKALEALNAFTAAEFEHQNTLNTIATDLLTQRAEIETKAKEDEVKAAAQTAKKIADIQRKTNATLANAIGNRDALAYKLAKEAAAEQIKTEQDAYAEREKELRDSLKKQLDAQDKAAKEAVAREEKRWGDERATRQRANQQIATDVLNAEAQVKAIRDNANAQTIVAISQRALFEQGKYQEMSSTAAFYLDYLVGKSNAAFAAIANAIQTPGTGIGTGGRVTPTPFALGGDVTRTGLALVHAGERIYTPIQPAGRAPLSSSTTISNNMGGVNINIKGMTRAAIKQEVNAELDYLFDKAGM